MTLDYAIGCINIILTLVHAVEYINVILTLAYTIECINVTLTLSKNDLRECHIVLVNSLNVCSSRISLDLGCSSNRRKSILLMVVFHRHNCTSLLFYPMKRNKTL